MRRNAFSLGLPRGYRQTDRQTAKSIKLRKSDKLHNSDPPPPKKALMTSSLFPLFRVVCYIYSFSGETCSIKRRRTPERSIQRRRLFSGHFPRRKSGTYSVGNSFPSDSNGNDTHKRGQDYFALMLPFASLKRN